MPRLMWHCGVLFWGERGRGESGIVLHSMCTRPSTRSQTQCACKLCATSNRVMFLPFHQGPYLQSRSWRFAKCHVSSNRSLTGCCVPSGESGISLHCTALEGLCCVHLTDNRKHYNVILLFTTWIWYHLDIPGTYLVSLHLVLLVDEISQLRGRLPSRKHPHLLIASIHICERLANAIVTPPGALPGCGMFAL
jgi:hypothetical protein